MQKLVILGGGESGYGAALLGKTRGYDTFLSDAQALKPLYKEKIQQLEIEFEENQHSLDRILGADLIVKSPGIPEKAPIIQAALARGIKIISEIEFASKFCTSRKICITGSNGKTTTTTLIHQILADAGVSVACAGNIGESFAATVALTPQDEQPDWYVIELSSFQLDGVFDFEADIALLLNITPDHLDRYDYQMSKYVASKLRIVRNQTFDDTFIYNADDPVLRGALPSVATEASRVPFSALGTIGGAWYDGEMLRYCDFLFPASGLQIRGLHNIANALSAIVAAHRAGVSFDSIASTLRSFGGVEHRMERVGVVGGVEYINDSKATNVDSVSYALGSMERPTVWIAGGTDKGNDYSVLFDLARSRVKALICLGVDNSKLLSSFEGIIPTIVDTHSLAEALSCARSLAESGDTVLLSPACASFDLFDSYEHRGELFKASVSGLEGFRR
ncbi:MAG: UDP-N-acetylmuramoyl-L-alanine--D-glutamate ligase [Rikenellaceae bacterium]